MDRGSDNSAQEIQQELSEIERDLTLRRLLWESQEEWDKLATEWTGTAFDALNVEHLQKSVNRFTQTVYMLEKGRCGETEFWDVCGFWGCYGLLCVFAFTLLSLWFCFGYMAFKIV